MSYFDLFINFIEATIIIIFFNMSLKKKNHIIHTLIAMIVLFISTTINNMLELPEISLIVSNGFICMIYLFFFMKISLSQSLILVLCNEIILNISISVSLFIVSILSDFSVFMLHNQMILTFIFKTLQIVLSYIIAKNIVKYRFLESENFNFIIVGMISLDVLYSLVIDQIFLADQINTYHYMSMIFINTLSLSLVMIFVHFHNTENKILMLEKEKNQLETEEKIEKINLQFIEELNHWKHDIQYIFSTAIYDIKNQNYENALKILKEYSDDFDSSQSFMKTPDSLLNHILLSHYDIIKEKKIHLYVDYSQVINPLEDTHYSIIVGNLLNNAIENCSGESKQIYIRISQKVNMFLLEIRNTIKQSVLENNLMLETTKANKEEHGFGLKSIRMILKTYDGKMNIYEEYDFFVVRILIPIFSKSTADSNN